MITDTRYRDDEHKQTELAEDSAEFNAPLHGMTNPELKLMQEITLQQMRATEVPAEQLLLGRVWYRLEQERRRRRADVEALERIYFSS